MTGEATSHAAPVEVAPEDQARAEFYALLARLWYAAPDQALLDAIADAPPLTAEGAHGALAEAWRELQAAASVADPATVSAEYDAVLVGTGKAEVTPYVSHYLVETGRERVLVALRDELAELGLGRVGATHEPEDHFAALCEVMRHLVGEGTTDAAMQQQKNFFTRYMNRAYNPLTDQVTASSKTSFYKHVARFTKAFCDVEATSLDML
jgi:TorA maturation chaperone TorD